VNKSELINEVTDRCINQMTTGRGSRKATINAAVVGHILKEALPLLAEDLGDALRSDSSVQAVMNKKVSPHSMGGMVRAALRRSIVGRAATMEQYKKPGRKRSRRKKK